MGAKVYLVLAAFAAAVFFFACATFGVDLGDVELVDAGLLSTAAGLFIAYLP